MKFKRLIIVIGVVVLAATIVFSWGCEKSQPTSPKLGEIIQPGGKTRPTCNIEINSQRQYIRGFGGMHFPRWGHGLQNDAQVDTAFGNGPGQMGFTVMRIDVPPDGNNWSGQVSAPYRAINTSRVALPALRMMRRITAMAGRSLSDR